MNFGPRTANLLGALALLALVGAACGRQAATNTNAAVGAADSANANAAGTNTASADTLDPCSLLTQAEAAAAFGKPAVAPARRGTTCRYDTEDSTKFFDLTARAGADADFATMENLCDSPAQSIEGLGASSCSANNTVVALTKGTLLTLIGGGVLDLDQLKALAVTAASRIP